MKLSYGIASGLAVTLMLSGQPSVQEPPSVSPQYSQQMDIQNSGNRKGGVRRKKQVGYDALKKYDKMQRVTISNGVNVEPVYIAWSYSNPDIASVYMDTGRGLVPQGVHKISELREYLK